VGKESCCSPQEHVGCSEVGRVFIIFLNMSRRFAGQDENGEGATNRYGLPQGLVTLPLLAGQFDVAWIRVMGITNKYDLRTLVQEDEVAVSELREQCC
jgi:hypothetical protein